MTTTIKEYSSSRGSRPVAAFINDHKMCQPQEAKKINIALRQLEEFGLDKMIKDGKVRNIIKIHGLFELRPDKFRLFFSVCQENLLMIYHIIRKTSKAEQDRAIDLAHNRMKEYKENCICK